MTAFMRLLACSSESFDLVGRASGVHVTGSEKDRDFLKRRIENLQRRAEHVYLQMIKTTKAMGNELDRRQGEVGARFAGFALLSVRASAMHMYGRPLNSFFTANNVIWTACRHPFAPRGIAERTCRFRRCCSVHVLSSPLRVTGALLSPSSAAHPVRSPLSLCRHFTCRRTD